MCSGVNVNLGFDSCRVAGCGYKQNSANCVSWPGRRSQCPASISTPPRLHARSWPAGQHALIVASVALQKTIPAMPVVSLPPSALLILQMPTPLLFHCSIYMLPFNLGAFDLSNLVGRPSRGATRRRGSRLPRLRRGSSTVLLKQPTVRAYSDLTHRPSSPTTSTPTESTKAPSSNFSPEPRSPLSPP